MMGKIVIVGLGLIGGSMAMGLKGFPQFQVIGVDKSVETLDFAKKNGVADQVTADVAAVLPEADVVILALHPQGIVDFLAQYGNHIKVGALVTDVCGVKGAVMEAAQKYLPKGVDFIGCHPMAGTEFSGITNAFPTLFQGAHFIFTPREDSTPNHIQLMEQLVAFLGGEQISVTTPEDHDQKIAYTSQMMHVIALAVCDDPNLLAIKGFEGSSFRGCTRVAALDVPLWEQLFHMNTPALLSVTDTLIENLQSYRETLASGDREALTQKLTKSSNLKKSMALPGPDLLQ